MENKPIELAKIWQVEWRSIQMYIGLQVYKSTLLVKMFVGPAYSNQISFHRAAYSWNFMFNQCDHFLECHADAPTFRVKTMQNKSIKKQKSESFCDIRMCFVCDVL